MSYDFDEIISNIKKKKKTIKGLYLGSDMSDPEGYFNFETFDVGFNHQFLKKCLNDWEEILPQLKEKLASGVESIPTNFDDPIILAYTQMSQIYSHEMFHLYQNLTLDTLSCYARSSRKVLMYKWYVLNNIPETNFKYKENQGILCKGAVEALNLGEAVEYEIFDSLKVEDETYGYLAEESDGITIIQLLEGAAVNFQLLISKDINCEVIPFLDNDETYSGAYKRFIKESSYELSNNNDVIMSRVIFLLISHYSLICEDYSSSKGIQVFLKLSKLSKKYFDSLTTSNSKFINKPNYAQVNELSDADIKYLDVAYKNLEGDNLDYYVKVCDLVDLILTDIKSIDPYFTEYTDINDPKLKAINNFLRNKFPTFSTPYFIPLLLSDFQTSIVYSNINKEIQDIEFKSDYGDMVISVLVDTHLINNLQKFEDTLDEDASIECCSKHSFTNEVSAVINCTEEDSFNTYFRSGHSEKKLSDIIEN